MVCFVILHYIATEETIVCVESILNNVHGEKTIIVVDNASPNDSFEILKNKYMTNNFVDVIQTECNLGFAKGNNFGYNYAIQKYHPDFIVVMNNDMEIKQYDFIYGIEQSFEQYKYYVMGPDIFSTKKGYHQNPQTRELPSKARLKSDYIKFWLKNKFRFLIVVKWWIKTITKQGKSMERSNEYQDRKYIDHVEEGKMLHGSCYVFSPLFISKHPKTCFYDKTFMYMEAEILYYLCLRHEEKMIYYPFIRVEHHEDVATDAEFKKQYKKSIFSVQCLLNSCKAFIDLMEKNE